MARAPLLALTGGALALVAASGLSLLIGARTVGPDTVWAALTAFDPALTDHVVIRARLERTVAGIAVGGSLAVAGAAMQGMTRNPLADPGILGLNAGAAAAVVTGIYLLSISTVTEFMAFAFVGAAIGTVVVYAVSSLGRDGATPVKLALAGPIGFLGLVVPHAVRLLVGGDYRRIVPLTLLAGPVLILLADVIGRLIAPPAEVLVGVMTALIGVPVFIVLIRSRRQVGL